MTVGRLAKVAGVGVETIRYYQGRRLLPIPENAGPVVWDSVCLEGVCGACTMVINGKVRQACSALIDSIAPNSGDTVTLEPMSKFPVVRDLAPDRSRFFDALKRAKAWVPIHGTYHLRARPPGQPDQQETRYVLSTCMSCGCCLEACPQFLSSPTPPPGTPPSSAPMPSARYASSTTTPPGTPSPRIDSTPSWAPAESPTAATPRTASRSAPSTSRSPSPKLLH